MVRARICVCGCVCSFDEKRTRKKEEGCTYTTAIARWKSFPRQCCVLLLCYCRRERGALTVIPTTNTIFLFFLINMLVVLYEKPRRKEKRRRRRRKKELLATISTRFSSHVHYGFSFSPLLSLISFCVVNGKTARENARV